MSSSSAPTLIPVEVTASKIPAFAPSLVSVAVTPDANLATNPDHPIASDLLVGYRPQVMTDKSAVIKRFLTTVVDLEKDADADRADVLAMKAILLRRVAELEGRETLSDSQTGEST